MRRARRSSGRVAGSPALVTLESPETERLSFFPMKWRDVSAAPSHFHTAVQHNGTTASLCFALLLFYGLRSQTELAKNQNPSVK